MSNPAVIMDAPSLAAAVAELARSITSHHPDGAGVVLVGIPRGGVALARRLAVALQERWGQPVPVGSVDIGMYRDDLNHRAAPNIHPTVIPCDISDRVVVLVDDVLHRGRSARAAMDALHDFGRPQRVQLAALIDRGGRELPIQPDFVGRVLNVAANENVLVRLREDDGVDEVRVEPR
jgi:pyrimidine operon attenuation protein/uracil phosphoribosyltransferase